MISLASDNTSGAHPAVLDALVRANEGPAPAYGDDRLTAIAVRRVCELLDTEAVVHFAWGGTAANVLGLATVMEPWQALICSEQAHVLVDECAAPERFIGCQLLPLPTRDGRLDAEAVRRRIRGLGVPHHPQPAVVSLTQASEYGTVYRPTDIAAIAEVAHEAGLLVHMDGARLANAAAFLDCPVADITWRAGVDVLSLGGTKNGLLAAEGVVFFDRARERAARFPFVRKQGMGLASKMRFVAAQFDAVLASGLWRANAEHANAMARRLAEGVRELPGLELTQPVEANAVFARLPRPAIERLQREFLFYVWDEATDEVRWMTAWDSTPAQVMSAMRCSHFASSVLGS